MAANVKRLAYFAATHEAIITPPQALQWLLAEERSWLWSVETRREAMRLLVAIARKLDVAHLADLEQAILDGPARAMYQDDIEPERWTQNVHREMWRLAKAEAAGAVLGQTAKAKLDALTEQYPQWQLAADERDEFPYWMGSGDEWRKFVATPRPRRELVDWLKQPPSSAFHLNVYEMRSKNDRHASGSWHPGNRRKPWIPAFAGMTTNSVPRRNSRLPKRK